MKKVDLICTKCKKTFPVDRFYPRCDTCNEPLEIEKVVTGKVSEGSVLDQTILERYADFFPFTQIDKTISLHEGFTPLVRSLRLASELSIKNIFFKNESQKPTWSFKGRGTITGIQQAISLGYKRRGG